MDRTLLVVLAVLVVVLVAFALTAGNQPLTIASMVLMGGFGFATVPGLQMRVMKYASSAPTLASGANIGAFNVGNALGAWLGGVTITAGLGYTSPIWAGAGITLLGLAVMAVRGGRGKGNCPPATASFPTAEPAVDASGPTDVRSDEAADVEPAGPVPRAYAPNGSRGSRSWPSQVWRTQPWCGSSLMSQSRTRPGPAMTLR